MTVLRAVSGSTRHRASLCARFDDHFTGRPVPEPLRVYLTSPLQRPIDSPAGPAGRQHDGTYRFIDLRPGDYLLHVASGSGHFVARGGPQPLQIPLADHSQPVVRELWPSPLSSPASGVTTVRGRLSGPGIAGLRVAIKPVTLAGPAPKHSYADEQGEFLFPYPGRTQVDPTTGRAELQIEIDGGARASTRGRVSGPGGTTFVGSTFTVLPGRETRVLFEVAP